MMKRNIHLAAALAVLILASHARPASADEPPRLEFTRLVAHWANYGDEGYLAFIKDARPDVAQLGFYGAHYWALAHTPQYKGYPAHFPVQGLAPCGDWFAEKNGQLHDLDVKVVGHMNVKFLVGQPDGDEGPRGFFKFYRQLWDEDVLGPRPVEDPAEFLERGADGQPIVQHAYRIGGMPEYWACLNNPAWRAVLKAWTRQGIRRGVDGFIINYFYRHDCHCRYCVAGFKQYLAERYDAAQLRRKFQIEDLAKHRFQEIVCWHDPAKSTPLKREMLRWSQIANKRAFDEVFLRYGRSLKPDLIVAQWNHLGDFGQIRGDERCLLPADLWGRGEDYLWYSAGASACFTDLAEGELGDVTLQARYIRGAFDDKPFTIGKYESTRIRSAIAELAASGAAPMGFYTRFTDPAAREEIVRYYGFLRRYEPLYKANRPHGEALLLFPRSAVHAGDVAAVEAFKARGRDLLEQHLLFDVLPDDLATPARRAGYAAVLSVGDATPSPSDRSRFEAPKTVRVSASRPAAGDELTLHLVNYNRTEPEKKRSPGGGIKDEKPIAAAAIRVDLKLPPGKRVARVMAMTPEQPESRNLPFTAAEGRVRFEAPGFLVYEVVRVVLK